MDYCHPCQRHLNGALACAGCGTPAEALGPYATPTYSGHEPEPSGGAPAPSEPAGRRRRSRAAAPARGGRGRGGHRRRGRGLLLAVLGVLLAVGALSLAELATEPKGDDGAADYVREAGAARTEPAPGPSESVLPDDPAPVDGPTVVPATGSHAAGTGPAGPADSAAPGKPREASASASASPSGSESPDPDESGPDGTTGPADPSDSSGPGEPSGEPTPPESTRQPTPTPSPTETCVRFLWWCT